MTVDETIRLGRYAAEVTATGGAIVVTQVDAVIWTATANDLPNGEVLAEGTGPTSEDALLDLLEGAGA